MSQSGSFMPKRIWLTRNGVRPDMIEERVGAQYIKTYDLSSWMPSFTSAFALGVFISGLCCGQRGVGKTETLKRGLH